MSSSPAIPIWNRAQLLAKPENIQNMGRGPLMALQKHLGLGNEWGVMRAPQSWLPPSASVVSHGTFRLAQATIANATNEVDLELARLVLARHVLLLLVVPSVHGEGSRKHMSLRTIVHASSVVERFLIRPALLRPPSSKGHLLSRLNGSDVFDFELSMTPKMVTVRDRELRRLKSLAARGLWFDFPSDEFDVGLERPRKSRSSQSSKEVAGGGSHHPFSDEFISEAGWRAAWMTQHLSATITEAANELHWIALSMGKKITNHKLDAAARRLLAAYVFHGQDGEVVTKLPFEFHSANDGGMLPTWPPKTSTQLFALLEIVQAAHLFIVLLSTGGRISEILSLDENCLIGSNNNGSPAVAKGTTYKLVFAHEGEERDWPLPTLAIQAIQNQTRMAALYEPQNGPRSLWCSFGHQSAGKPLSTNYRRHLAKFTHWLMLEHLLGDQNMRAHRFRKTIARLVALAIVEAPKVLMDIFGHKSIAMTMRYILTDPLIRADMDTIRREMVVMLAENAIESAETNGGPAALPLRNAIREVQVRSGSEWGKDDIRELAFALTANGDQWALVRPGVLCTKQVNQSGPCNVGQSTPDPSRCRTHCTHRLEEASARDDADRSIEQAIEYVEHAIASDNDIEKELWMGQILGHLERFNDVKEKWRSHPIVSPLLGLSQAEA